MKNAIVIGATSGIGRALAIQLDAQGYRVGITGRRTELLDTLSKDLKEESFKSTMDISIPGSARNSFFSLAESMGDIDLIVISSGTGFINPTLEWEMEETTIMVNVLGFTVVADAAMELFRKQNSGHLVGISSLGGIRGEPDAPAYNASKAYVSNYLEGLTKKIFKAKLPITVTDIQPGLIDTAMAKGEGLFWVMPVEKVVKQIMSAIQKKKGKVVVTKRWRIIGILLKTLPFRLYRYL